MAVKVQIPAPMRQHTEGKTVVEAAGTTVLTGQVADQAVLHGLLQRVRDLNVPLVSVCRIDLADPCPSRRLP